MNIKDLEGRIRVKEDKIAHIRRDMEGAHYSNQSILDNNAQLQLEIDALNNHIRVIT